MDISSDALDTPSSITNLSLRSSSPRCGPCSMQEPSLRTRLHSGQRSTMPESGRTATTVPLVRIPRREPPLTMEVRSTSTQCCSGSIDSQGASDRFEICAASSTTKSGEPCQNCTLAPVRCRKSPGSGSTSHHAVRRQRPLGSMTSPLRTTRSVPSSEENER